jgi:hypothetical protein
LQQLKIRFFWIFQHIWKELSIPIKIIAFTEGSWFGMQNRFNVFFMFNHVMVDFMIWWLIGNLLLSIIILGSGYAAVIKLSLPFVYIGYQLGLKNTRQERYFHCMRKFTASTSLNSPQKLILQSNKRHKATLFVKINEKLTLTQ